jgi:predicted outer membrane repeat protein
MKKMWFLFVLVSALLGFTPLAWPAVFYVTPTSDNDCSDFNCDFQNALNAASGNDEGDTINLGTGFYDASSNPFVWNTTKNYPLTIIGSDGAIIDGGNASQCMYIDTTNQPSDDNSHVTIQSIIFQNGNQPIGNGGALFARTTSANMVVAGCSFRDNASQYGGGAQIISPGSVIIRNNVFKGNTATNIDGGGISITGNPTSTVVEGNLFFQNRANVYGGAISVNTSGTVDFMNNVAYTNTATFGSVQITTSDVATINNNTLTSNSGNSGGCLWVNLITDTAIANIYNNIIWNETGSVGGDIYIGDIAGGGNVGAVANLYNNNFSDFFSDCSNIIGCAPNISQGNNKNVNPQFVNVSDPDPTNWDLRLASGSEAIDTGDNTMCALTDILGIPRPQDGDKNGTNICDMGAYEVMPVELSTFEGTIGTELTISGSGFGTKKGKVLIENAATKIITWSDTEIACTVKKVPLPAGSNNVIIKPSSKTAPSLTLTSSFTVMNPVIDAVILGHGLPGEKITIFGRYFSTKKGKVYLEYIDKNGKTKKKNCRINSWDMNAQTGVSTITFEVPKGLESSTTPYPLYVTNKVGQANSTFMIGP